MIISLMKKKFVDEYHWIEEEEMLDLTAIAQSAPGAVAVNGAIVVGYKLAGAAGVLISILGTVIPPFVILSLISVCYQAFRENWLVSHMLEGMQAGVGAVIASVTYEMGAGVLKRKRFPFSMDPGRRFFCFCFSGNQCGVDCACLCRNRSSPNPCR